MKSLFLTLIALISFNLYAQETGAVSGLLTDKEFNNEPLAFANILIKDTAKGTTSDFDGNYLLENLEPGKYTIVYSFVGYKTVEVETIVEAGKTNTINVILEANSASLDEVVIKTTTARETENALLLEQQKAVLM